MNETALSPEEVEEALAQLGNDWEIEDHKLRREFTLDSFVTVIDCVNTIAELAEQMNHHPDLHIYYKKLVVELWTHKLNGLSDKDFALAQQITDAAAVS